MLDTCSVKWLQNTDSVIQGFNIMPEFMQLKAYTLLLVKFCKKQTIIVEILETELCLTFLYNN